MTQEQEQELFETRCLIASLKQAKEMREENKRETREEKREEKQYKRQRKQEVKEIMKERTPHFWWLYESACDGYDIQLKDPAFAALYASVMPGLYIKERKLRKMEEKTKKKAGQ